MQNYVYTPGGSDPSWVLVPDPLETLELARLEEESPACGPSTEAVWLAEVEPGLELMVWEGEGGALGL
ncbi:hypothetical protein [Meiothermus rufus]|uniref:hypothetical protein n=1 Tax=Meiothermus rufus TaxID=604332 RepID=UPI0004073BA2|nr:hypothetical protein [Meiothermus rufus]